MGLALVTVLAIEEHEVADVVREERPSLFGGEGVKASI
jgi:hypothetical protein